MSYPWPRTQQHSIILMRNTNLWVGPGNLPSVTASFSSSNTAVSGNRHIIFRALVPLKPLVSLICLLDACSARTDTHTHTHTQTKSTVTLAAHACQGVNVLIRIFSLTVNFNKWKNHFSEMKGDVGMSHHEKEGNKKMPIPRQEIIHNPIPTSSQ